MVSPAITTDVDDRKHHRVQPDRQRSHVVDLARDEQEGPKDLPERLVRDLQRDQDRLKNREADRSQPQRVEHELVQQDARRQNDGEHHPQEQVPAEGQLLTPATTIEPGVEVTDHVREMTILPLDALLAPRVTVEHQTSPGASLATGSRNPPFCLEGTSQLSVFDQRFGVPGDPSVRLAGCLAQRVNAEEGGLTAEDLGGVATKLLLDAGGGELVPLAVDERERLALHLPVLGDLEGIARHHSSGLDLLEQIDLEVVKHLLVRLDVCIDTEHEVEVVRDDVALEREVQRLHLAALGRTVEVTSVQHVGSFDLQLTREGVDQRQELLVRLVGFVRAVDDDDDEVRRASLQKQALDRLVDLIFLLVSGQDRDDLGVLDRLIGDLAGAEDAITDGAQVD